MRTMWGAVVEVTATTAFVMFAVAIVAAPMHCMAGRQRSRRERLLAERRRARCEAWWRGE